MRFGMARVARSNRPGSGAIRSLTQELKRALVPFAELRQVASGLQDSGNGTSALKRALVPFAEFRKPETWRNSANGTSALKRSKVRRVVS